MQVPDRGGQPSGTSSPRPHAVGTKRGAEWTDDDTRNRRATGGCPVWVHAGLTTGPSIFPFPFPPSTGDVKRRLPEAPRFSLLPFASELDRAWRTTRFAIATPTQMVGLRGEVRT